LGSALTLTETKNFIASMDQYFAEHGFGLWATVIKETETFIGFVGLKKRTFEAAFTPCVEIGWRIASAYWSKGYATEGAKAVLKAGFNTYSLKAITSWTAAINKASMRVMEKIGMIRDVHGDFYHPQLPIERRLARHVLYRLTQKQYVKLITDSINSN
jgi:RimJ/RimL family protein N-acetyltransferase